MSNIKSLMIMLLHRRIKLKCIFQALKKLNLLKKIRIKMSKLFREQKMTQKSLQMIQKLTLLLRTLLKLQRLQVSIITIKKKQHRNQLILLINVMEELANKKIMYLKKINLNQTIKLKMTNLFKRKKMKENLHKLKGTISSRMRIAQKLFNMRKKFLGN